ncbi:hypothetical protein [Mesorhizobium amorphae]|uniref:Lipoprotein n=1 Tax=Mesorhizobium amorphae CCNWGS0123 TaxID=1082933 RepID=G6YKI7_9HYPH|nr:hypothetical protein [Mesorhizobium amorphae]EHH03672.1 hypothetical protein MEA186_32610 [Mesorhizobium amorphae CCNWGS0123]GLR42340.1 hypothetical protein GCM10007880_28560 [Mesorhizobium amorphae]
MNIPVCAALGASLALAGCNAVPPEAALPAFSPADPAFGITNTHYHPVVNYVHREPTDPQDWRRLNDNLSPAGKGAGS